MDTLEKLRFITSDTVRKEDYTLEKLSTSLKTTYPCGCMVVQHGPSCGVTARRPDDTDETYARRQAEREFYIELCPEHNALFRQQMAKHQNEQTTI